MSIKVTRITRNVKGIVWLASYTPETQEAIWFGHIKTSKSGKRSFVRGRRPEHQSRSGYTHEEALTRLHAYLDAAFQAYVEFNPDYRETTNENIT